VLFRSLIQIPEEARRRASSILQDAGVAGRYVVVHPGSGGSAREWPQENFGLLARMMLERMNVAVVVTGTAAESAPAEAICRAAGGPAVNLAGKLSLKELAALLERASLLVAHSTGPLHVGVALGTPVVGLYPQIPVMGTGRWGPYTDRARVLVPDRPPDCAECAGKPALPCACMASISVASVYAAAGDLLSRTALTEKHHAHET
jgi:ADP-heptose:LPS heptosyltransferase